MTPFPDSASSPEQSGPIVVYGAREPNFGSCGSVLNLFEERYGHHPAIYGGVLADDCAAALRAFFGGLRG